jgi:hypothetical protein
VKYTQNGWELKLAGLLKMLHQYIATTKLRKEIVVLP